MLFKQEHLEGIKKGSVSLAFRKWNKLAVKEGSLIKTSVGIVAIRNVTECSLSEITAQEALEAGFTNLKALTDLLSKSSGSNIYRMQVNYESSDPRLALRAQSILTDEQLLVLKNKVARLDQFSKNGSWTIQILKAIEQYPKLKAADLAIKTGKEKDWLKLNIRKLKNLGLTISYEPGYTLSPLGIYFLSQLEENES